MYSTNGREKKSKEVASQIVRNVLMCLDCNTQMSNKSKEFGEKTECTKCGSTNLEYQTNN